ETDIKAAESSELKAENTNSNSTKANDLELVETDIKAAESSELKAENTNGNSTKANDLELVETDIKAAESNELKSEDTDSILPKSDDFESNYSDSGSLELNSHELTSAKNSDSRNLEFLGNTAKAFVDKETLDTSKAIEREIMHDSYFYNGEGKRANLMVAQKGSVFSTYGTEIIGGREFYLIDNGLYIAANNVNAQKRILLKNSFVYNKEGKRIGSQLLKRNTEVDTYGDPVRFDDKEFYTIDVNRYVKAVNFGTTNKEVNETLADGVVANAVLNHSARLYNSEGQQKDQVVLSVGSRVATGETRNINGRMFIEIGDNQYLDSDELTGTSRVLTTKADVYNNTGKRIGKVTISVGDNIRTYGEVTIIQGKAYYSVGNGQFVKQTAFE
ncbi:SLAP domain-containing protein, partial [Lactobacillus apis]